ncbi:Uncharacterized protein Fot_14154 [Forsythia ovata]|uniref:Uncharacterized protein n=1 Tax=Forsythia ovata TaxID=205694 RepID=A0ABD1W5I8_9LAMI
MAHNSDVISFRNLANVIWGKMGSRLSKNNPALVYERNDSKGLNLPEIDFLKFGGEDPKEWLQRAETYLPILQVDNEKKMEIVKSYMEGMAYVWSDTFGTIWTTETNVIGCLCTMSKDCKFIYHFQRLQNSAPVFTIND